MSCSDGFVESLFNQLSTPLFLSRGPSFPPWSPSFVFIFHSFFSPFASSPPLTLLTSLTFTISSSLTLRFFPGRSPAGHAVLRHLRCPVTASPQSDLARHPMCPPARTVGGAIRPMSLASWASATKSPTVSSPTSPPILLIYKYPFLVSSGQSLAQLQTDFANMRKTFNSRYVRLYGACDNEGF